MTRSLASLLLLLVAIACAPFRPEGSAPARSDEGGLLAGVAAADLTPGRAVPLAGYGKRRGRAFVAVHDRPQARALVLRSGAVAVAVVSADLLLVPRSLREAVHSRVADLDLDGLLLAASHTHSGPGGFWDNELAEVVAMGRFDRDWAEEIADRLAGCIRRAADDAVPARVRSASESAVGLARNRRFEDGPLDDRLGLLVVEPDGPSEAAPIAWIVDFGAHPTILGPRNLLLSGDYPGALRRRLEAETSASVLFLNGAGGDQAPILEEGGSGFAAVEAYGAALAERLLDLGGGLGPPSPPRLGVAHEPLVLPSVNTCPLAGPVLRALTDPLVSLFTPERTFVQAIRAGDARLLAFPCDLGAGVGLAIRARFPGNTLLFASYANDYVGYVVERTSWERGGYEAMMSFYGPTLGERFEEAAGAALRALERP